MALLDESLGHENDAELNYKKAKELSQGASTEIERMDDAAFLLSFARARQAKGRIAEAEDLYSRR